MMMIIMIMIIMIIIAVVVVVFTKYRECEKRIGMQVEIIETLVIIFGGLFPHYFIKEAKCLIQYLKNGI